MNWATNNIITELYGPAFLLVYAIVIVVTLVLCRWQAQQPDSSAALPPRIPKNPDPYEIAYLRGGEREVIVLTVVTLMKRGYLQAKTGLGRSWQTVSQADSPPDVSALSALEQKVFEAFRRLPLRLQSELLAGLSRPKIPYCDAYKQHLQQEGLLTLPEEAKARAWRIGLIGALVIEGLGFYKVWAALTLGYYNVWFTILMALFSLPFLIGVCKTGRLTRRGQEYLKQLQHAFERLKTQPINMASDPMPDSSLALVVGLFGVGALMGTPYNYYPQVFGISPGFTAAGSYSSGSS